MKPPKWCGQNTMKYILKTTGILGAVGTGLYTTNRIMWGAENIRWTVIYFYLSFFALFIISAELNILRHPFFVRSGKFLTTYTGRAIFYIFMGGLMLHSYGWYPGIWMMATGLLNIIVQCSCGDSLKELEEGPVSSAAAAASPSAI